MGNRQTRRPERTEAQMPIPREAGLKALAAMPSLGRTSAEMLIEAGILSPEMLRKAGPEEAWRRLRFAHGKRVTINFIYAIDIAISGGRWDEMDPDRQEQLKNTAEAIKAEIDGKKPAKSRVKDSARRSQKG
jgi:DNA transformation protein and related proteins